MFIDFLFLPECVYLCLLICAFCCLFLLIVILKKKCFKKQPCLLVLLISDIAEVFVFKA